jgi:catechol 2,3-dioxygenase-like lactoylglutathione lyase family enzyme
MDHVGLVVVDLRAAIEFFLELGLELQAEWLAEGESVDRIVGLEGVRADVAMLRTPGGGTKLELSQFHSPPHAGGDGNPASNAPGIRHITFEVDDIEDVLARLQARGAELVGELERAGDTYRLCYLRGPDGIIVELAEKVG